MGTLVNYQLLLLLTYLAFAIAFWAYQDSKSRYLLYISVAWIIQAMRYGGELIQALDVPLPSYVDLAGEAAYLAVVGLLFLGVVDSLHRPSHPNRLWTGIAITCLIYISLNTSEGIEWLIQTLGDPARAARVAEVVSGFTLHVSAGLLLLLTAGVLLRRSNYGAAFFLAGCFAANGLLRFAAFTEAYLDHPHFNWILEDFSFGLAYSVGFLLVAAGSERNARIEKEAELRKSQLSTLNYTRDFPGMAYRCAIDSHRTLKFVSPGVQKFTGYLQNELVDNSVIPFIHIIDPSDRTRILDHIREKAREGAQLELIYQIQTSTGTFKWAWEQGRVVKDENGKPRYLEGFISDVTRLRETEIALEKANEELIITIEQLEQRAKEMDLLNKFGEILQVCTSEAEAIQIFERLAPQFLPDFAGALFLVHPERKVIRLEAKWNGFDPRNTDFNPTQCTGLSPKHPLDAKGTESICGACADRPANNTRICATLQIRGEILGLLQVTAKPGTSTHHLDVPSIRRLMIAIAESFSLGLSNIRLRETLRAQAIMDPLTSLHNRRYFKDSLKRELQRAVRRKSTVGLIVFDLDHFKKFNDTFGHAAGDEVLKEAGSFLKRSLRSEDIVCRYGGEEFVVLFPDIDLIECRKRAEELRKGISRLRIQYEGRELGPVTASIGVSVFPTYANSQEDLFEGADRALYEAKRLGRNRVFTVAELERDPAPLAQHPA